jgi:hypothetical protein
MLIYIFNNMSGRVIGRAMLERFVFLGEGRLSRLPPPVVLPPSPFYGGGWFFSSLTIVSGVFVSPCH